MKLRPCLGVGAALLWTAACSPGRADDSDIKAETKAKAETEDPVDGTDDQSAAKPEGCEGALAKLSRELESATAWDASRRVWPGLELACGDTIPKPLAAYFRPFDPNNPQIIGGETIEKIGAFKRRACPDIDAIMKEAVALAGNDRTATIYRRCDFARYEVIDERDAAAGFGGGLMVFTFHQWMLDEEIEAKVARPITRALFGQESLGFMPSPLPDDFEMPAADGRPVVGSPALVVTTAGARFNDREVVRFGRGFKVSEEDRSSTVIAGLFDQLAVEAEKNKQMAAARDAEWDGELVLVADARIPYGTLTELLGTAERAEFSKISIVTSRPSFGFGMTTVRPELRGAAAPQKSGLYGVTGPKGAVPVMPRRLEPEVAAGDPLGPEEETPFLALHLTADGFTLSTPGIDEEQTRHDAAQLETITERSAGVAESEANAGGLVLSADPDVSLSRIISALEAARGPDCTPEGDACLLTEVTLVGSDAHAYRPPNWPSEDVWGGLTGVGKRVPEIRKAKFEVRGDLDKDIVRGVVQSHTNEVEACYKKGLDTNPNLEGRVAINFVINSKGKVGTAVVQESTLKDKGKVGSCLTKAIKKWKFPKPSGGGNVIVTYPFELEPG